VFTRFQQQFRAFRIVLPDNREPAMLTDGDVMLHLEAEHSGIEIEGLGLVFDKNASHVDFHARLLEPG
jgi:hypothetical protein